MQNDFLTAAFFLVWIVIGILNIYRPTLEWLIRFGNSVRGVNTEITNLTVVYHRVTGIIMVVVGIFFVFLYLVK